MKNFKRTKRILIYVNILFIISFITYLIFFNLITTRKSNPNNNVKMIENNTNQPSSELLNTYDINDPTQETDIGVQIITEDTDVTFEEENPFKELAINPFDDKNMKESFYGATDLLSGSFFTFEDIPYLLQSPSLYNVNKTALAEGVVAFAEAYYLRSLFDINLQRNTDYKCTLRILPAEEYPLDWLYGETQGVVEVSFK